MSRLFSCLAACLLLCISTGQVMAEGDQQRRVATPEEIQKYIDGKKAQLHLQTGKIELMGNHVTLNIPADFGYLNPHEAEILLHDIWGNPPSNTILGVIVPAPLDINSRNAWAILLRYDDDGHVKDDDAKQINYDELFAQMKEATEQANETRKQQGYPTVHLVGWAEKPYYDEATHKLYWAKEFTSDATPGHFLNYDIRVLGREGVLIMSVLGDMEQLPMIHANRDKILSFVEFNDTHKYGDFNASTDRVAAYGLAALVAGSIAAKAGLFKGALVGLLALKKFVVLGLLAVLAFLKRIAARLKGDKP